MRDEEKVGDILADWLERRERGEAVDAEAIAQENPGLADALLARFAAIEVFDRTFARVAAEGPRVLGDFRILREIARGGMGIVYEAEQLSMGRQVALKVLSPATTLSEQAVARFRREAQAAGRLHHTHIVPVYAMGEAQGIWYYAMELVRGRTLAQVIEDLRRFRTAPGAPSHPRSSSFGTAGNFHVAVATQFAGVAEALAAAHAEGIVHRDVKPSNLILDAGGVLKVMDFGLARVEGEAAWRTLTGEVIGTPAYMSPEQTRGDGVDARTDVYSLGATLYELLTLEAPFQGRDLPDTCARILSRDVVPPRRRNARIPRDLETIVLKAMEKERWRRYATAADLARDLRAFAEGGAIRARRVGPLGRAWRKVRRHPLRSGLVAAVVVLAATAAAAGLHASREARLRRAMEYERLCAEAEMTWRDAVTGLREHCMVAQAGTEMKALLDRAIGLDPYRVEAYVGRVLMANLPAERRLADIETAHALGLGERTYRLARAWILSAESREEAETWGRKAMEVPAGQTHLDAYFEGRILLAQHRWQESAARLTDALRLMPRLGFIHDRALLFRGFARERQGDLEGAVEDMSSATSRLRPSDPLALRIASLWRRLGRESRAEECVRRALEAARQNGTEPVWMEFCDTCGELGEWDWAKRAAEEGVLAFPDSAELRWRQAHSLASVSREVEARSVLDRPGGLRAPESHAGCEGQVYVLSVLGRNEEALAAAERALRLSPRCYVVWGRKALILRDMGRVDDALLVCEEGRRVTGHQHLWCVRGLVLAGKGRHAEAIEAYDQAIRTDPGYVDAVSGRANSLKSLGKWEEAILDYDRALAIDARFARARINKAGCCHLLGRHDEALALLDRVEESGLSARDRCLKHEFRGNTLLSLGRLEDAIGAYGRALEVDAGWVRAHTGRSVALRKLGRHEEAVAAAEAAVRSDPKDAWAHEVHGMALDEAGDRAGAVRALDATLALDPKRVGVLLRKGQLLDMMGQPQEALPALEAAVQLDPDSPEIRNSLGIVLNHLGRCADALASLDRAIELKEDMARAHGARSYSLRRLGRRQDALAAAKRAVELDPKSAEAHEYLGQSLTDLGDHRGAIEEYRETIRLDPTSGVAYNNLGTNLLASGSPGEAIGAFDEAIRLLPKLPNPHFGKAEALFALRKYAEASREYEETIRIAPQWPPAHYGNGRALSAAGAYEKALEALDAALKLQPGWSDALVERGNALENLHRFDEAIHAFTRAAEIAPGWATPWGRRGFIYCLLHRPLEGVPDLEKAVQIDPKWFWARWHLASALADIGRFDDSLAAFVKVSELSPDSWGTEVKRAEILIGLGRHDEALAVCDAAIARFEKLPVFKRMKVSCLLAMGKSKDAALLARESAVGDPAPEGAYDFAYLLAAAGKREEFDAVLKRFGDPTDPIDAYTVALGYAVLGDAKTTLSALRAAAEKGYHHRSPKLPPDPHFTRYAREPGFAEALRALVPR